jgi:hypothetical protein
MRKHQVGSVYRTTGSGDGIVLQLVGRNDVIGDIARVGRLKDKSLDGDKIETLFIIGFPFIPAIKDGYLRYMESLPIPDGIKTMKFRFPNIKPGGAVVSWTILAVDGQKIVSTLDRDQLEYPLAYAVNIQKLEELIEEGWSGKELIS